MQNDLRRHQADNTQKNMPTAAPDGRAQALPPMTALLRPREERRPVASQARLLTWWAEGGAATQAPAFSGDVCAAWGFQSEWRLPGEEVIR